MRNRRGPSPASYSAKVTFPELAHQTSSHGPLSCAPTHQKTEGQVLPGGFSMIWVDCGVSRVPLAAKATVSLSAWPPAWCSRTLSELPVGAPSGDSRWLALASVVNGDSTVVLPVAADSSATEPHPVQSAATARTPQPMK